ncbi:DNA-binding transcriptional LysR family regulator [Kibdelosporangium banguiense]|uniref:DNA-binding transcriptional LysR family regulator n=1 Tax=Kibdelosporangium banguiense TaxID=1365924 RepID=A0ABS4TL20_9PSEU|nr:LysR family transcriptional regulator [Kibdelosporangium banguiense]MBP2325107.1 DNA-binding transcriptional LysR family regulator [Kibdelosporangium banguiense]
MTLTQLSAFVLVARLGSVKAAACALGVSEPAVSQALGALRHQFGDSLVERAGPTMRLTTAGSRLLPVASQMVALGADAEQAVRTGKGIPDQLRVVASSTLLEFVATPLVTAFSERPGRRIDASAGGAATGEMPVLLANRFADVALGPGFGPSEDTVSEPVFRTRLVVVTGSRPPGGPARWIWLADSSATDPAGDIGKLLRRLRVPDERIRVFPSQTAAWAAAADGQGVAIAPAHLITARLRRGELQVVNTSVTPAESVWYLTTLTPERRSIAAETFRHFLSTATALRVMREPGAGVLPSRFKPPVYVTLWS